MLFSSTLPVGKSCRKGRCMTTWSRTRPLPPASMPGGLNRYATESFASINRFSTCRMSSHHHIIRDRGDGAHDLSLRRAVENCRLALTGEPPLHIIGLDERLM